MAMNLCHRRCCSSNRWAKEVEHHVLPSVLADVDLGDNILEIGPRYGAFLRVLIDKTAKLTAVEIDTPMAQRLQQRYGDRARIIDGDGTDAGMPANEFSSMVCFTMLHHVPTAELQDRLFAEAFRVLRPGGVFAGCDGVPSPIFRILHFRDTCNPIPPQTLPDRLRAVGFADVDVKVGTGRQRWRAVKAA
jgi:SAM-dependent methyltransferase